MSTMRRWLLLLSLAKADLVFDPSVERVIVNVGSNTQPSLSHDPQTVAIAVEPMVGCRIREQRNLHVLHAAVAANNTLAFMQWYNKFGESSSLGTATEKAEYTTRYRGKRKIVNVISLTTLVESIPLTVKLWYLKTDMQGFDFDAITERRRRIEIWKSSVCHVRGLVGPLSVVRGPEQRFLFAPISVDAGAGL